MKGERDRERGGESSCVYCGGQKSMFVNVFMWYSRDRRSVQLTQFVSWDKNEWHRKGGKDKERASKSERGTGMKRVLGFKSRA